MQRSIPYSPNERNVIDERPGWFGGPPIPVYNTPVLPRQNACALYFDRQPYWISTSSDIAFSIPDLYNEKLGRAPNNTDVFNRYWEFVEMVGGSITHGGNPLFTDVNEWKDKVTIPNVDDWDWAKAVEDTKPDRTLSMMPSLVNGFWFERLISFMDFEHAAVALIDEDQHDAIIELFTAMTDLAIKVVDKLFEYFPGIDGVNIHDDWGSQQAPFFSEEVARKLFFPFMKELNDHIHSKGRYTSLHSCGHNESRIELFIEAGYDEWSPQPMNDTQALYEKYGDKIILSIYPDPLAPDAADDDYRQAARDYVDRFCQPGKPSTLGFSPLAANPAFAEELYIYSRKHYANMKAKF
ncbi:MAG: methyltransferase [Coriobacteriia bacterium]|nr:methyltransferase [Coriobacteriia bacterium]